MTGGWRVVGASVQGASHRTSGQPCQDALSWNLSPGGVLFVAAADGAGSAELSLEGASTAVSAASLSLQVSLWSKPPDDGPGWKKVLTSAMQTARTEVEHLARTREVQLRDLASTLIVVAATDEMICAAQVGDGAIVIDDGAGQLVALTRPQSGEYINETTFLISADYLETAQFVFSRRRVAELAVLTDGLQMLALKMPGGEPHRPFFAPLFKFARSAGEDATDQLRAFLQSPKIAERADDDLTLFLAVR